MAYSINALVAAVGENKLIPDPDCQCLVINGDNGYARNNTSWILGRLVRDYDAWMHQDVRDRVGSNITKKWNTLRSKAEKDGQPEPSRPTQAGLCVSFYKPDSRGKVGEPMNNDLYMWCILVAILQLGIAAIPCGISGDWGILMITVTGIILSTLTASLSHWKTEKFTCRRLAANRKKNIILTRGNGSQHAIVILGQADFLDLEDLAAGQMDINVSTSNSTRLIVTALAVLWILLLITAAGLKQNTWFLLAVGTVGIFLNIYVAGTCRDPRSNGIPLVFEKVIAEPKVMPTLYLVEEAHPHLGRNLLPIFFPGELNDDEKKSWQAYEKLTSLTTVCKRCTK